MSIERVKEIIREAESVVFFGGAGVSTDSGIPDFRSSGGLYSADGADAPERILRESAIIRTPERFYNYYRSSMLYPYAEPNPAHRALAALERAGKLTAVVTQNIDGLHQAAGSENVIELHGSVHRNYCLRCGKKFGLDYILEADGVPYCDKCGGLVRPDVVMYGEGLDGECFSRAEEAIGECDVLIVGGTSLTVNPAASLVADFMGEHLIIVNRSATPYDGYAEFIFRQGISEFLTEIVDY